MTHEQKLLAIWCAGALITLVVAGYLIASRGDDLEAARVKGAALHEDYRKLYPDQGVAAADALAAIKRLRDHQEQARAEGERQLVGALPDEYQRSDVTEASSRMRADLSALKQRGERLKIALPAQLPFETSGFDQTKVSLQLAQLYLYKQVLDLCMDAGVTRVTGVRDGRSHRDASGVYAVLTCEFVLEGNFESLSQLIVALRAKHPAGLGVRDCKLSQAAQTGQCTLMASLLTANNPQWQLGVEGTPAIKSGAGAGTRVNRSRLDGAER